MKIAAKGSPFAGAPTLHMVSLLPREQSSFRAKPESYPCTKRSQSALLALFAIGDMCEYLADFESYRHWSHE
eukprot:6306505-Amphidinium_carterae.1